MKKKTNLAKLEVKSFVTSMKDEHEMTIKGGADGKGQLTVITRGYWSVCCGPTGGTLC